MSDGFKAASFEWLLKEAVQFAFHVAAVNRPLSVYGPGVLPVSSTSCVETRRDGTVAFNFASRGVQAMVASDIHFMEGVLDEAAVRMKKFENYAFEGYLTFAELEREIRIFLDGFNKIGALDDIEVMDFALDAAHDLLGKRELRL